MILSLYSSKALTMLMISAFEKEDSCCQEEQKAPKRYNLISAFNYLYKNFIVKIITLSKGHVKDTKTDILSSSLDCI
jgi:hypothetical protein